MRDFHRYVNSRNRIPTNRIPIEFSDFAIVNFCVLMCLKQPFWKRCLKSSHGLWKIVNKDLNNLSIAVLIQSCWYIDVVLNTKDTVFRFNTLNLVNMVYEINITSLISFCYQCKRDVMSSSLQCQSILLNNSVRNFTKIFTLCLPWI